jgi:hypothetical protein
MVATAGTGNDWWSRHPAVSFALGLALVSAFFLFLLRSSWAGWRRKTEPRSARLGNLKDFILWATFVALATAALAIPDRWSAKGQIISYALLWGAATCAVVSAAAWRAKRIERRADENELREHGFPVRPHHISWQTLAVFWYFSSGCGVVALFMVLAIPVIALGIADPNDIDDPALLAALATAATVWLAVSAFFMLRRYGRRREANREYWREYRRAMVRAQSREDGQGAK